MNVFSANDIRQAVRGRWLSIGTDVGVEGVTIDSRTGQPGHLFVAIRGEHHDGHDYLIQAAQAGCVCAIVDRSVELDESVKRLYGGGIIGVDDTVRALGDLAAAYRQHLTATIIAVTGSNGKTTVKRMIHHILSMRMTGKASPKSFNNAIGVPLTLLAVETSDDYAICEVGTNAPGEILGLARIIRPQVAVITQVSQAHLEGLGHLDRIAIEKASLLAPLEASGMAIVNGDNEPLDRALAAYDCRTIRFGESDYCELRLTDYQPTETGQRFQLNGRLWVDLPLLGRHNAFNALAAIAVAQRLGFDQDQAAAALSDFTGVEMRLEPVDIGPVRVINDAYNANPASMLAAWQVLCDLPAERRVCVVGDMRELGEQSLDLHRQVGERISTGPVDLVVGVGELGQVIADIARQAGLATAMFDTTAQAEKGIASLLTPGDVILLKGSRSMGMDRLVGPIRERFEQDDLS
jgi:UDP-N-acetylmuramoyl-tripeptide--D-alanyl-D-alanine ligase